MWEHDHDEDQPTESETQNAARESTPESFTLQDKIKILRDEVGLAATESVDLEAAVNEVVETIGLADEVQGMSLEDKVHLCLLELGRDQVRKTRITAVF